jgi:hypothetical protein
MSELRIEPYEIPAASLGEKNPLPALHRLRSVQFEVNADPSIPKEQLKYVGYGTGMGILPYRLQDGYDRNKKPRDFKAVVLENEFLHAVFLPEVGGRLWSLIHKPSGTELLHRNPVFQPCNLALRNAWLSGGVEWNCAIQGHTPFTCSPLHTVIVHNETGTPVLRMYEWERIRQVPYQIDFWLPEGSQFLYVHVRIVNPHAQEIPMYWWSNIAVDETPDRRVMTPAESCITSSYGGWITRIPVPYHEDTDVSYSTNTLHAADYFYDLPEGKRPWITSLDKNGQGLIQTSTPRLLGRKLFIWGNHPGGARWQEYLAAPGHRYVEIQAGLARTQMECIPMPAQTEWDWTEAYGMMNADAGLVHGKDWNAARGEVVTKLDAILPMTDLKQIDKQMQAISHQEAEETVHCGSGWGALEALRRQKTGTAPFCSEGMVFTKDQMGTDQHPWYTLLEQGRFHNHATTEKPGAWMVQPEWRAMLEDAVKEHHNDHWLTWLHIGVMRYAVGDYAGAKEAWLKSVEKEASGWAYRNLAVIARDEKDMAGCAELMLKAIDLLPTVLPLFFETLYALLDADRAQDAAKLIDAASEELRQNGRTRVLRARAAFAMGDLDLTESILSEKIVIPDLREGENTMTDLWYNIQAQRIAAKENIPVDDELKKRVRKELAPPKHLDFRMFT